MLPRRRKTQWDYLLEEMKWMAKDFMEERIWKKVASKTLGRTMVEEGVRKMKEITEPAKVDVWVEEKMGRCKAIGDMVKTHFEAVGNSGCLVEDGQGVWKVWEEFKESIKEGEEEEEGEDMDEEEEEEEGTGRGTKKDSNGGTTSSRGGNKNSKSNKKSSAEGESKQASAEDIKKELEGMKAFGSKGWKQGELKKELDQHAKDVSSKKRNFAAIIHGGKGKTKAIAQHLKGQGGGKNGKIRHLVLCPPQAVNKWRRNLGKDKCAVLGQTGARLVWGGTD
jgi:hypothetical protein